ncbi:MAG: serine/threonine protein kinase [Bifidobacterium sp.]|nr:serine/threonine protein kinase [Bifidobacterium sp.]
MEQRMLSGNPRPPSFPGYTCMGLVASGSTAVVYHLRSTEHGTAGGDPRLAHAGDDIAVKVGKLPADPDRTDPLHREARCLARLRLHPHILAWYGAGITEEGHGYLVLDYAAQGSCLERLKTGVFGANQTLAMGISLAGALATAHRAGYLHRDIKPGNVLITGSGSALLADFGICASVYRPNSSFGLSLPWAAPEVVRHISHGSEASDVYSLAATLFALLCGYSPYEYAYHPRTHDELSQAILSRATPMLAADHAPSAVARVLHVAMSYDCADRFDSAIDFARALQRTQHACFRHITPLSVDGLAAVPAGLEQYCDIGGRGSHRFSTLASQAAIPDERPAAFESHSRAASVERIFAPPASQSATLSPTSTPPRRDHRASVKQLMRISTHAIFALLSLILAVIVPSMHVRAPPAQTQRAPSRSFSRAEQPDQHIPSGLDEGHETQPEPQSAAIAPPQQVNGSISGDEAQFRWINPDPHQGDVFIWMLVEPGNAIPENAIAENSGPSSISERATIRIPRNPRQRRCIQVRIMRADRRISQRSAVACTPYP